MSQELIETLRWLSDYDNNDFVFCANTCTQAADAIQYLLDGADEVNKELQEQIEENERLKAIEDILGDEYDLDRLRELAQADREGRCVVLPCKPSDVTVYQLRNKKHARGVGVSPRHIYCATVWANGNYALHHQGVDACLKRDFNKTWFLNEEEAEAALRREQDG